MATAKRYYTKNETTGDLEWLKPPILVRDGEKTVSRIFPTPEQWAAHGAYPRNDGAQPPTPPEGKVAVPEGWEVRDGAWHRTYRYDPAPTQPPRRWSRLSIKGALADAHMLPAARVFLSSFEIKPDYTAWEALTDCDYIEEGYGGAEAWSALLDGAAQALGKTRAEIDAFLDNIPQEA